MAEASLLIAGERGDDVLIASTSARLSGELHIERGTVETAVRDELARWRSHAKVQAFVPVIAERTARARLRESLTQ